jgi:hypothetical protein
MAGAVLWSSSFRRLHEAASRVAVSVSYHSQKILLNIENFHHNALSHRIPSLEGYTKREATLPAPKEEQGLGQSVGERRPY